MTRYLAVRHVRRWFKLQRRTLFACLAVLVALALGQSAVYALPLFALAQLAWLPNGSTTSIMTTELNSLASTGSAISSAIDNDASQYIYADFELVITYGTNPTAGTVIELYIIRQVDGSNYEDGSTTGPVVPANGLVGAFKLRATTSGQRIIVPLIVLPPGDFKVMVWSRTSGQTAAASGNTLIMRAYTQEAA